MKSLTGALALSAAMAASSAAFAQGTGCDLVPERSGSASVRTCGAPGAGRILSLNNPEITVVRGGSVLRLRAGSALASGDRILLRGAATATISLGGACSLDLFGSSTTTLVMSSGRLCVAPNQPSAAPAATNGGGVPPGGLSTPAILGGAVVGAGAITGALLLNRDETRRTISQPAAMGRL